MTDRPPAPKQPNGSVLLPRVIPWLLALVILVLLLQFVGRDEGVDYVAAIYRSLTSYPQVLEDGVEGNPDRLSPEELLAQAWPVVEPRFVAEQRAAAERYEALAGTGRTANELGEVLRAAFAGRVETLFAALGTQRWGTFDETSRQAEVHAERRPGDGDLVDLAAVRSLVTGADVHAVEPERVPGRGAVAAILRY